MMQKPSPNNEFPRLAPARLVWLALAVGLIVMSGICAAIVYASLGNEDPSRVTPNELPREVTIEPQLNAQVPLDITLRDEIGQPVQLKDLLKGKPVLLTLVYFQCPMLCNMTRDGQIRALTELTLDAGDDFTVLTVSFDPRETSAMAKAAKTTVLKRYDRPGAVQGWRFLTGEESQIRRLTESVGFHYKYDEKTGQYAHAAGLIILTPEGKISRYLYGVNFEPRDLRLALVEASGGNVGTTGDQVLLLCYHYDPTVGKYGLAIMNVLRFSGVATVLGMVIAISLMIRRDRQRPKLDPQSN